MKKKILQNKQPSNEPLNNKEAVFKAGTYISSRNQNEKSKLRAEDQVGRHFFWTH